MPKLLVTVVNANDLKNTQLLGTQNPYVEIRSDLQRRYTQTHENGGQNPRSGLSEVIYV